MAALKASKQALRKQMKLVIGNMLPEVRETRSKIIMRKVRESPVYRESQRIAVFLSMMDEVETKSLLDDMFAADKRCFIPKYEMKSRRMDMLELRSVDDLNSLPRTKWDIQQPADDDNSRENAMETGGLDLILMPGLAFTLSGKRLGRGKGYYDTFLNNHQSLLNRRPVTMALAFSEQVLEDLPTGEFDYTIDQIVSDT